MSAQPIESPRMELVTVTPEIAQQMLSRNGGNRRVSLMTVKRYASLMRSGLWRHPTSEALSFDMQGRLQDGQHRLLALIDADITLKFWVMLNADPDDFHVLNQGKIRGGSDVLGMLGAVNTNALSSVVRQSLTYEHHSGKQWATNLSPATPEVARQYEEHRDEYDRAMSYFAAARRAGLPASAYCAVAYLVSSISESMDLWEEWHREVTEGAMLSADSAAFVYRKWCISPYGPKVQGSLAQQMRMVITIKAWNAHAADRSIKLLRWRRSELPMPSVERSEPTAVES